MPRGVFQNWPAMFVAYCQNHPISEIATTFNVGEESLKKKISDERWAALRDNLVNITASGAVATIPAAALPSTNPFSPRPVTPLGPPSTALTPQLKAALEVLHENRQKNLGQAKRLQAQIDKVLTQLESGKLEIDQIFCNKGTVVKTKRGLNMQDFVALATYMKMVHEMTYRALGDTSAVSDKPGQDLPVGAHNSVQPITIILPGVISEPRQKRGLKAALEKEGHKVVDVPDAAIDVAATVSPAGEKPASTEKKACEICEREDGSHDEDCPYAPE